MTAPTPDPRNDPFPPVIPGPWAPRLVCDIRRPWPAVLGSRAGARARRCASRRGRRAGATAPTARAGLPGTSRRTPPGSPSRTVPARTSSGTRCNDGPSRERAPPAATVLASRWINIPPPPPLGSRGHVDHYPAARWIRVSPPPKGTRPRSSRARTPTRCPRCRSGRRGCRPTDECRPPRCPRRSP